jgi:cytochrome c biogenesis protein ResB
MSTNPVKQIWLFLTSKKLAVTLILLLTVASTIGMLMPKEKSLNLVFSSKWFLAVSFIFLLNLSACTIEQVIRTWKIWKNRKNELPLGSLFSSAIIHLGLILVVVGGFITFGFKMTGYMTVMEGEIRREIAEEYEVLSKAPFFDLIGHKGYGIGLDRQQRILDKKGKAEYILSDITLYEGDNPITKKSIEAGKPLMYNGFSFNDYDVGFVPLLEIKGVGNSEIYKGYLFLDTVSGPQEASYVRKNFSVPGTSFVLNINFSPDLMIKDKKIKTRRFALSNPGMEVTINQNGQEIAKGIVTKGEKLNFAGNTLTFSEVRHWIGLEIIYDPGANILFAGCWIVMLGLFMMLGKTALRQKKSEIKGE